MSGRSLLRLWFTFSEGVDRKTYVVHGLGLAVSKYAVDAVAVWTLTRTVWTPAQYLSPFLTDRNLAFIGDFSWLSWCLIAWSLPFAWIGVSMSMRRAVDAGLSAWTSLLFFVPFVNYGLILVLSVLPSKAAAEWRTEDPPESVDDRLKSAMMGIAVGVAIVILMVVRNTFGFGSYGAQLFIGTPFVLGAVCGYVYNYMNPRTVRDTLQVVALSMVLAAGALLLFALEGAICLIMALPLALPVGLLGGLFGRVIALRGSRGMTPGAAALIAFPLLVWWPWTPASPDPVFEVVSAIEVHAPPGVVWDHVVGFSELPPPSEWVFRLGIAYPVRAVIDGTGVGAVRRCEFSTGAFVEPITAWERPRRLAFDVVEQPRPLEEWSPYRDLHPRHLDGYFRSVRGEFRLRARPDGGTTLEGSTWYELDLAPAVYWTVYADLLIGRIHERVLRHVKRQAEAALAGAPVP